MSENQRRHPRLKHRAKIRMTIPSTSLAHLVDMRDFSETGLYLICGDDIMPPVGAVVEVQTTEFDDAPVQIAKVVRIEPGAGFAVTFLAR